MVSAVFLYSPDFDLFVQEDQAEDAVAVARSRYRHVLDLYQGGSPADSRGARMYYEMYAP